MMTRLSNRKAQQALPIPEEYERVAQEELPEDIPRVINKDQGAAWAGENLHLLKFDYTKLDGTRESYLVEPYSFRDKRPKRAGGGSVRYLFAYDIEVDHIKGFIWDRCRNLEISEETFEPRFEVEL